MMSLFSPFDLFLFSFPLAFSFVCIFLVLNTLYQTSPLSVVLKSIQTSLGSFFLSLKPKLFNKFSGLFFLSLFFFLLSSNFFSVFSFNFPSTSQVSLVMWVSSSIWLSMVLFSIITNFKGFLSHLIPEGTPLPLTALLFIIELVSSLIRPLTLTVRLVANILAGHLLMSLLSSLVFKFELTGLFYVGLNMVELFVAMIQAYIFTTMIVLYFSEV